MPLVTVALLTYNRAHLVGRAIQSVLDQSFRDFELIISDDNSTDDTASVVNSFLHDGRVSYVRHPGIGMTQNFIDGLRLARGSYFMWLCDDDYISNDYLEKTLSFLQANKDYALAAGLTVFFSAGKPWDLRDVLVLESNDPIRRLYTYFRHVNNNVILYGLMRLEEVKNFVYPDTFGADLLWSAQVAYKGKIKILEDCCFYYSKEGISQDTQKLADYYVAVDKQNTNPYTYFRKTAYQIIGGRKGGFRSLSFFKSKWVAARVWMIIRDRFCITPREARLRSKLRIGTRLKALTN